MSRFTNRVWGVLLVIIGVAASISGLFFLCFGIYGFYIALLESHGGFVGEGGFYASALLLVSGAMIAVGPILGFFAFLCFKRFRRFLQSS